MDWLEAAEHRFGGVGVIVMYAKNMLDNDPILREASGKWQFVSPRSSCPSGRGPVLALWPPNGEVLQLAEQLALDTALCVVAGPIDISGWIRKSGARSLIDGFDEQGPPPLSEDVRKLLDGMLSFGGHNGFIGAGEKEYTIRILREVAASANAPRRDEIDQYLFASGKTTATGIHRVLKWYDEIRSGKRHRDYQGHAI